MGGGWMWILVIFTWVTVAVIAYLYVDRNSTRSPRQDPVAVLDMQLARGDIEIEDYRARRKALNDSE
jgi:uncharacterized membrane protein